jgi:hypothetical protein
LKYIHSKIDVQYPSPAKLLYAFQQPTPLRHNHNSMQIPNLPTLNPKLMTVWQTRRPTKIPKHINTTNSLIDHIATVGKILTGWNSDIARIGW